MRDPLIVLVAVLAAKVLLVPSKRQCELMKGGDVVKEALHEGGGKNLGQGGKEIRIATIAS